MWWDRHDRAVFLCETKDGIAHIVAPCFGEEHYVVDDTLVGDRRWLLHPA